MWKHILFLLVCLTAVAPAQERGLRGTAAPPPASIANLENSARVQIDRAESLLRNGSAEESLEAFRRVINQHGDRMLEWPTPDGEVPRGFTRYGSVRDLAWMRLATLHQTAPELLASFRRQIDPQARRWFEQLQGHDESLDRRIIDELFLSSFGDNALLRLGDFSLERGEYNVARQYWEQIAPGLRFAPNRHEQLKLAANRPLWLPFIGTDVAQTWPQVASLFSNASNPTETVYPDTDLSLAAIRSRLATASIMEGNFVRARIEIDILKQLFPDARGTVAGVEGNLVAMTQDLLTEAKKWPPIPQSRDWTTFAGSSGRNRVADPIDVVSENPLWSVKLPTWTVENEVLTYNRIRVAEDARALLPYFPLIVGDLAIIQTQPTRNHVQAFRLRTGESVLPGTGTSRGVFESNDNRSTFGVPRYAPTALGMSLYLLEGLPRLSIGDERRQPPAKLEAIDLSAERKLLWEFDPLSPELPAGIGLAGPPVSDGTQLFICLRKREAARDETYVAALDPRDGRLLWKQFIGAAEAIADATWTERTQHLLTVDQGTVYCNTNCGLVAALETRTGRMRWITSYPRSSWDDSDPDRNQLHFYRDLNPCLVHRDLVIVAPTDCNRLFAIDATSGIPIWVTAAELAADAIHLLGVVDDRVVVSGECVYWFDVRTGQLVGRFPEPFKAVAGFARPSPRGFGRGILAGHNLYWPTKDAILVFQQGNSAIEGTWTPKLERRIALAEQNLSGGNLVVARNTLLIAGPDKLVAFDAR